MSQCPPQERLEQFLEERLSDADRDTLARHVESCERCQTALEGLTHADAAVAGTSSAAAVLARSATLSQAHSSFLGQLKQSISWGFSGNGGHGLFAGPEAGARFPEVSNYEILEELGRGGMGVVYKARQISLNRLVALKMILSGPHARRKDLDRFRHEAESVARLRHPNIIQIYDIGEAEGRPYLALEFVDGDNLGGVLNGTPQACDAAARLSETLARAVHYAHQQGIVHRDLKPANVLLQKEVIGVPSETEKLSAAGQPAICNLHSAVPKITDFGLAKRLDAHLDDAGPTGRAAGPGSPTEEVVGTPSYMAPEQAAPEGGAVGPAADVYTLGAILYELLTGRPPFRGPTSFDTVLQVLHEEPARPSYLRPDLPRDLETICLKCLAKDPARRYSSADALAEDLYRFRHGKPILARPVGVHERIWKWARRRPLAAGLLAGMLLVAVLGFAGITWQWQEARFARDEKEVQRQEAVDARAEEEVQRKRARASLYFSRIAQGQLYWRVNDYAAAYDSLEKCRPLPGQEDRRGWEWHYLRGVFDSALFTRSYLHGGLGGSVAFEPQNRRVVSVIGGFPDDESVKDGEVRIWDATRGDLIRAVSGPGTLHRLAIAPDGKQLALGTTDGSILIWDAFTCQELLRRPLHAHRISGLAYHPKGGQIASSSWDGTVKIWDSITGAVLHELRGHDGKVQGVAYHPQGKLLASCGWDATVRVWNADTGQEVAILRRHKRPVACVAFSPDGKLLASASQAGTLRLWDMEKSFSIVQTLTGYSGSVLSIAFSPDGRYVAKGGKDGTVRIWDLESGIQRISFRGHGAPVESVHFSPDGRRVASVSPGRGTVKVWDLTRHPEYATFARSDADLETIAFEPGGKRLVSANMTGKVQFWNTANGLLLGERHLPVNEKRVSPGMPVSLTPDGRLLAGRDRDDVRIVRIWDTTSGGEKAFCGGLRLPVQCVRFSPDGRYLAIAGCAATASASSGQQLSDHEVSIWNVSTGQKLAAFTGRGRVFHVAFSAQADWLAWAHEGGSFSLVDWQTQKQQRRVSCHKTGVGAIAFSHDGKLLASAGLEDRTVRICKMDKLLQRSAARTDSPAHDIKETGQIVAAPSFLCDLAFSPDGTRLAGISQDVVKIWEVDGGQELLTMRGAGQRYWDPPFNPRIVFSPDGTRLAGTNWDESISIWDAPPQNTPEDAALFQARRRERADQRTAFWHLQEAEHCLDHKNFHAAGFHLERLGNAELPPPLETRKQRLIAALANR